MSRPNVLVLHATVLATLLGAVAAHGQSETTTVAEAKRLQTLEKNSTTFRFGLSVGWRHNGADRRSLTNDVGIEPTTGNVFIERGDRGAFVLSGVVAAYPWRRTDLAARSDEPAKKAGEIDPCPTAGATRCRLGRAFAAWHWGAMANLNLASFSADAISTFNKSIEGGMGVAYKLNEDFSVGATVERIFGRRPRSFVVAGQPIKDKDGKVLYAIDRTDDTYFRDDNMTAWSLKFVYFLK